MSPDSGGNPGSRAPTGEPTSDVSPIAQLPAARPKPVDASAETVETDRQSADESVSARPDASSVAARSAPGLAWTLGARWMAYVVQLVGSVFLARLLSPRDYGLFGMVLIFTGLAEQLRGLGLNLAVVQSRKLTQAQVSQLFWINVAVGVAVAIVMSAVSPLIASFYGEPLLVGITVALSPSFIIASLAMQHQGLLLRRLEFKRVALRTLTAGIAGTSVAIVCASFGMGYWALVAGQLGNVTATAVALWIAVPWRPDRPRRGVPVRELLHFGAGVSAFNLLNYAARNADNLVIGRFLGPASLGFYSRAYGLLMLPLNQVHQPVTDVARPSLTALRDDPAGYRRYYLRTLTVLLYTTAPILAVTAALADEVIRVLLGPQWLPAAPVFRLLAIGGVWQLIAYTNGWLYASTGRGWQMARWALVTRPIVIGSFFVGLPWGVNGVAAAYSVVSFLLAPPAIVLAARGTPVRPVDVLKASLAPIGLAAGMGVVAFTTAAALPDVAAITRLLASLTASVVLFGAVFVVAPGPRNMVMTTVRGFGRGKAGRPAEEPA